MKGLKNIAFVAVCLVSTSTSTLAQSRPPPPTQPPKATPTRAATATPTQSVQLISISPNAEQIIGQYPDAPGPVTLFYFKGTKGTQYSALFSVQSEPATVVGIGANIDSTSFDDTNKQLTVNFVFDQSVVTTGEKTLPSNVFFLGLDPGVQREFNPLPRPGDGKPPPGRSSQASVRTSDTSECYGPLGGEPSSEKGPPREAAGSFFTTNFAEWCVISPNESQPFFGFKFRGVQGSKGFLKQKVSPALVSLLSKLSGTDLSASNLAIFNGDVEASRSITATSDGGVLISIKVNFKSTSTIVTDALTAANGKAKTSADSTTTVDKTITTSESEVLSIAPNDFQITGSKAPVYGFVSSSEDIGKTVSIQKKRGNSYKTVASAVVGLDGSYIAKIPSTKVFGKTTAKSGTASIQTTTLSKSATLVATIIGSTVKNSREITLKNKISNLRR